jgi:hypothetical protein
VQQKCNTVRLSLNLMQVSLEQCVIPSGSGVGDLSIVYAAAGFHRAFSTHSAGVVFRARAAWIHVDRISAYSHE